jgi:hypothetical protein
LRPTGLADRRIVRAGSAAMSHRFRTVLVLLLACAVLWTASCGTIIHPERINQPRVGRLDFSIVLLDGLGLLFFFVPGVVAFVVDFATGAIYLPPGYGDASDPSKWRVVHVPKDELTRAKIAEVVARETGKNVDLESDEVFVERLRTIDEAPEKLREER